MSKDKLDYDGLDTLTTMIKNHVDNKIEDAINISSPTGTIQAFSSSNTPVGWLLCDGSAISRTTYSNLFAVIGTTYGSGDGSTTFNLPNLFNRMVVGAGNSYNLAATGGEATHALSIAELAVHSHTFTGSAVNTGNQSANHTHSRGTMDINGSIVAYAWAQGSASGAFSVNGHINNMSMPGGESIGHIGYTFKASNNWSGSTSGISANHNHSVTAKGTNSNTGSGTAHNNMPPYIAMRYIIKY